jgi:N-acetylneuraminate synthase
MDATTLSASVDESVPILVPEGITDNARFVSLPVSNFSYLETLFREPSGTSFRQDFALLTVLEVLSHFSSGTNTLNVKLYGFDFDIQGPPVGARFEFLKPLLERQRDMFQELLRDPSIFPTLKIIHGSFNPSPVPIPENLTKQVPDYNQRDLDAAISQVNQLMVERLAKATLGQVQIVAELTNNHLGCSKRLEKMVRAAYAQGADVIKVQKREPKTFYSKTELEANYSSPFGATLYDYRAAVELSEAQFDYLTILCAELGVPWFASALDEPSLIFLEKYEPVLVKIPSTISNHRNFIRIVAESRIPSIVVSLGATDEAYVEWLGDIFSTKNLVLMQCTSSYPAQAEECNISVVSELGRMSHHPNLIKGYSSHDPGSLGCQLSIALGATFIEKHTKYGSVEWVHFDGVALDLESEEFQKFTLDLRQAVTLLGAPKKIAQSSEVHKYTPHEGHN